MDNIIQTIAIYALPVIFAITLHEAAHGYVAKHFGDLTAYAQGRVSLNPIRHIDPIGTILLPLVTLLLGGILFGWAKPVPVNFSALRRPKQDMLWVALAGPGANLFMALLWGFVIRLGLAMSGERSVPPDDIDGRGGNQNQHCINGAESAAFAASGWRPRCGKPSAPTHGAELFKD